ncbi:hypothetical protein [Halobacteriovorax marinus]|nr:hypothetical protein [Halobacteriovorax marinus]
MKKEEIQTEELDLNDILNPEYFFNILKSFLNEDELNIDDHDIEEELRSICSELPTFNKESLSELEHQVSTLLEQHNELKNIILLNIHSILGITFLFNSLSNLKVRKNIENFPTAEEVQHEIADKKLSSLGISEEVKENIIKEIPTQFDYDKMKTYTSKAESFLPLFTQNKNFPEYMFYTAFKGIFQNQLTNYWHLYFDFLNLCHKNFPELFSKKFNFSSEYVKENRDRINRYIKTYNKITTENYSL